MASGWGREVRRAFQNIATSNAAGKTFTTPFAGLDTTAVVSDDASGIVAGTTEPSSSNGYARQSISWTAPPLPAADAAAIAANSGAISWTSSGGGFSTGATTLKSVTLWNTSTLATVTEAAFLGRAPIAVPQAVNAAGITLTIAIGGLSMGCISA
jgi:hypothetical protein